MVRAASLERVMHRLVALLHAVVDALRVVVGVVQTRCCRGKTRRRIAWLTRGNVRRTLRQSKPVA